MCYCKPDVRTPFCPNCPPIMARHIKGLRRTIDVRDETITRLEKELESIKKKLKDII